MEKLKDVYLTPPLNFQVLSEIMTSQDSYIGSEKRQYASEVIETEIHDEWGTVVEEIPEDDEMPLNSKSSQTEKCLTRNRKVQVSVAVETKSVKTQTCLDMNNELWSKLAFIQHVDQTSNNETKEPMYKTPLEPEIADNITEADIKTYVMEKHTPVISDCPRKDSNECDELNIDNDDRQYNSAVNTEDENSEDDYKPCDDEDVENNALKGVKAARILSKTKSPEKQLKFIVFEEALVETFQSCAICGANCVVTTNGMMGTYCKFDILCANYANHRFSWSTGPLHNHMPILNLLMSSATMCGGMHPNKVIRFFQSLNIPFIKQREYSNLQGAYVIPAVYNVWEAHQKEIVGKVSGKTATIASDMRVDSPGHSGLLGAGSSLDVERNLVLDTQIIQVKLFCSL